MRLRINNISIGLGIGLILSIIILATGLRPSTVGSDTLGYLNYYQQLTENISHDFLHEYLFEIISRCLAVLEFSSGYFLSVFALFNYVVLLFFTKKLSIYFNTIGLYRLFFLLLSFLCMSPFFLSSQLNVLRHGTAILILFLYYLSLLQKSSIYSIILLILLALGFHSTALFSVFFSLLIFFPYSIIFRSALLLAMGYSLGLIRSLIHMLSVPLYNKIVSYGVSSGYLLGIRYDFVIFTLSMGLIFHFFAKYCLKNLEQEKFFNLLKIYWLLTFPFFFWGFGAYSDRYLLPAWMFLSVILAVFVGLILKRRNVSIYWYFLLFFLSSNYFILRAQGIIG